MLSSDINAFRTAYNGSIVTPLMDAASGRDDAFLDGILSHENVDIYKRSPDGKNAFSEAAKCTRHINFMHLLFHPNVLFNKNHFTTEEIDLYRKFQSSGNIEGNPWSGGYYHYNPASFQPFFNLFMLLPEINYDYTLRVEIFNVVKENVEIELSKQSAYKLINILANLIEIKLKIPACIIKKIICDDNHFKNRTAILIEELGSRKTFFSIKKLVDSLILDESLENMQKEAMLKMARDNFLDFQHKAELFYYIRAMYQLDPEQFEKACVRDKMAWAVTDKGGIDEDGIPFYSLSDPEYKKFMDDPCLQHIFFQKLIRPFEETCAEMITKYMNPGSFKMKKDPKKLEIFGALLAALNSVEHNKDSVKKDIREMVFEKFIQNTEMLGIVDPLRILAEKRGCLGKFTGRFFGSPSDSMEVLNKIFGKTFISEKLTRNVSGEIGRIFRQSM